MPRVFPLTESDSLDLRNGTAFKVYTVTHTTGEDSTLNVDQSAASVAELPTSGSGQTKANVTVADSSATDGVKEVTIASAVVTGTYTLVVRFAGSGAGIGSSKPT